MVVLYTIGYGPFLEVRDLLEYLKEMEVEIVIDVRDNPYSRREDFCLKPLAKASLQMGLKYVHLKALGNIGRKEGKMILGDSRLGMDQLSGWKDKGIMVLLCACGNWKTCHRSLIVELVEKRWPDFEVVNLMPPGKENKQMELF